MDRNVPPSPEEAQNERKAEAAKTADAIRVCRSDNDTGFISAGMRGWVSGYSVGGFSGKSKSDLGEAVRECQAQL
jgi:hypothetical protein